MKKLLLGVLLAPLFASFAQAHHSFAVHFEGDRIIEVTGTVEEFRFTNPHGVLLFTVIDEQGNEVAWRAETNSPGLLRRRGWNRDDLVPGDYIVIQGYPARKEANYMRISHILKEDGTQLTAQGKAD